MFNRKIADLHIFPFCKKTPFRRAISSRGESKKSMGKTEFSSSTHGLINNGRKHGVTPELIHGLIEKRVDI